MSEDVAVFGLGRYDDDVRLGQCWAALRGQRVVGMMAMKVPADVDFELYRDKATEALALLGEVKSGQLIERDGLRYFVQRLTHANRGKVPRRPKEFLLMD